MYAHTTGQHDGHPSVSSSPFIRQGFGRISTTSGKFNLQKEINTPTNNTTVQTDEGRPNNIACNRILNYINHRPLNYARKNLENSKTIENRPFNINDEYRPMCPSGPATLQCKVNKNVVNFMWCYFQNMFWYFAII